MSYLNSSKYDLLSGALRSLFWSDDRLNWFKAMAGLNLSLQSIEIVSQVCQQDAHLTNSEDYDKMYFI